MTAVSGAVVWSAKYSSFGEADVDASSTITNNLRFPGQYYDSETGLHYNWYRYYDPSNGRYLTPDPIGLAGGINVFGYVKNNPLKFMDPRGLIHRPGESTLEARIKHCVFSGCSKEELEGLLALAKLMGDKAAIAAATAALASYTADDGEGCDDTLPTKPEDLEEFGKEHDRRISEDTKPEIRTPPHFPPPEPDPPPKKGFWKKVRYVIVKAWEFWINRP